jgi:hypothetical protein
LTLTGFFSFLRSPVKTNEDFTRLLFDVFGKPIEKNNLSDSSRKNTLFRGVLLNRWFSTGFPHVFQAYFAEIFTNESSITGLLRVENRRGTLSGGIEGLFISHRQDP